MSAKIFLPLVGICLVSLLQAKTAFAAMNVTNLDSSISVGKETNVAVDLSGLGKGVIYYLKAAFYTTTPKYFGLTWNGSSWVKNSASFKEQFPIFTDQQGRWSGSVRIKVGIEDNNFQGPGSYFFKVARYTANGSLSWSSAFPIEILAESSTANSDGDTAQEQKSNDNPQVQLSEFLANPEKGGKEWVELYNASNFSVNLDGWQLADAANHEKELTGQITKKSYKVFEFSSGWLNNSGDTLKLIDQNGKTIESYSFPASERGVSFAKNSSGKWKTTNTPTPGKQNKFPKVSTTSSPQSLETGSSLGSATGLESTVDYLNKTLSPITEGGNYSKPATENKVASTYQEGEQKNSSATLFIAAGFAFLGTGALWPFLEKLKP